MGKGNKDVGYRHETEVAGLFSDWWRGAPFHRIPNSGSLRWNDEVWTYGDLLPPEDFPAVIECKRRKTRHWHKLLTPGLDVTHKDHPLSWWQQAQDDAKRAYEGTHRAVQPIVVAKTIRKGNRIFLEADLYNALGGAFLNLPALNVTYPGFLSFAILDLVTFFAAVDREAFLSGIKAVIPAALVEAATT